VRKLDNKELQRLPGGGTVGPADALIMARSGLERVGLADRIAHEFSSAEMLPAVGQGIVAVECAAQDWQTRRTAVLARRLGNDRLTSVRVSLGLSLDRLASDAKRLLGLVALLPAGLQQERLPRRTFLSRLAHRPSGRVPAFRRAGPGPRHVESDPGRAGRDRLPGASTGAPS